MFRYHLADSFLRKFIRDFAFVYPAPSNLTYFWNFGVFALLCLVIQIITGLLLTMNYVPHIDLAFDSVERIMRDVNYGWLLRYVHANGASVFFMVVYIHIFRGLYYASYRSPRFYLWTTGVIILLLMIITAFIGYVLPWGQMSFWGATVITSLATSIPIIGEQVAIWLWSGFVVSQPTLNKFFALHYLLPFVLLALVGLHLAFLHENRSNNPLGIDAKTDEVPFTPYYTVKDFFSVILFFMFFAYFVFFNPNVLGHPDNYIPANPEVTPAHIVPEWYFLLFYAILRSVPNKLLGIIWLLSAIGVLLTLPVQAGDDDIRYHLTTQTYKTYFAIFVAVCVLLTWCGQMPVNQPYLFVSQVLVFLYFAFFSYVSALNEIFRFIKPIKKKFRRRILKLRIQKNS